MAILTNGPITVTYHEMSREESPAEGYTSQEGKLTRVFITSWQDRWKFCQAMLGWTRTEPDPLRPGLLQLKRFFPQAYGDIGRLTYRDHENEDGEIVDQAVKHPWLYATDIPSVTGIGPRRYDSSSENNAYQKARIEISYEKRSYHTNNDFISYVTKFVTSEAESAHFPFGKMKFVDDQSVGLNGTKASRNYLDLFLIWHQVPRNDLSPARQMKHIAGFLGCLNSQTMEAAVDFPRGTLLMVGAAESTHRSPVGHIYSDYTYRFKYLDYPPVSSFFGEEKSHNHYPRFSDDDYKYVPLTTDGLPIRENGEALVGGNTAYPYRDFDDLFRVIV